MLALVMWFGRFAVIVPVLAIAGALGPKVRRAAGPGTLPTHGPLFVGLLVGTIVMVASLARQWRAKSALLRAHPV